MKELDERPFAYNTALRTTMTDNLRQHIVRNVKNPNMLMEAKLYTAWLHLLPLSSASADTHP